MSENHCHCKAADCAAPFSITIDDVPTDATLAKAGSEIHWLWKGWLQSGVLTALAAEGETGKTRFCLDLVRRIRAGLPWPDGQPMTLPADSRVLWVLSDNHHDEWRQVCLDFGIKPEGVYINAHKTDLYGGGSLVTLEDRQRLEARVQVLRPALVFIDTVENSTELNLSNQKNANKYYEPLQLIAARHQTAILCITRLNIARKLLSLEKVRVAIAMDKRDPEQANRRRLSVIKSNSKSPPPLGITMGDHGNEYYAMMTESSEEKTVRHLVELIQKRGGKITLRELMRTNNRRYPDQASAEAALKELVDANLAQWIELPAKKGKPIRAVELCMPRNLE